MVVLHTPQGDFETGLSNIAETVPQRLASLCTQKHPRPSFLYDGYPFQQEIPLGNMDHCAVTALGYIFEAALLAREHNNGRDINIDGVTATAYDGKKRCYLNITMQDQKFSQREALDMKDFIRAFRDEIMDIRNYHACQFVGDNGKSTDGYTKVFDADEVWKAKALHELVRTYNEDSKVLADCGANDEHIVTIDEDALRTMIEHERPPRVKQYAMR